MHSTADAGSRVSTRRAEYDANVWDHTKDAFQLDFDVRRPLDDGELDMLQTIVVRLSEGLDDAELAAEIHRLVGGDEGRLFILMQQAGLTRNKIITDLRAASAKLDLSVPGKPAGLLASPKAWKVAGPYLALRLRRCLEPLTAMTDPAAAFESINQATWPHWIRQERAKRQGHEAEYRVAVLLDALEIPFEPAEKSENPLCRDAQIAGISYDLVVPSGSHPSMVMKSTVQTSNIGQFGESKAHLEITEAASSLADTFDSPPVLLALVDGVGFRSNTAGLHGVLAHADEFCQFRTIWKAATIAAAGVGQNLNLALPHDALQSHELFLARYGHALTLHEETDELRASLSTWSLVEAGEGLMWSN